MVAYQKGQLVTVVKDGDSFRNFIGKVLKINENTITVDLKYLIRDYKRSEITPISQGPAI